MVYYNNPPGGVALKTAKFKHFPYFNYSQLHIYRKTATKHNCLNCLFRNKKKLYALLYFCTRIN